MGRPAARVQNLLLDGTRYVTVGPLKVAPLRGDALLQVRASRNIVLRDLTVSARGSRWSAGVDIPDSRWVTVQQSEFSHCGDRSPNWVNCLSVTGPVEPRPRRPRLVPRLPRLRLPPRTVRGHLTVSSSRFERTLPCDLRKIDRRLLRINLGRYACVRCKHQDLIELFAGNDLRFVRNYFGVYKAGGAQLYVTGESRRTLIAHNVFRGTDRRVPGWRAPVAVLVGGGSGGPIPTYVRVEHNKIYTGATRRDGYAGSISISRGYGWRIPRPQRPVIAHNVIGLLKTPSRLCNGAKMIDNTILRGQDCQKS